MQIKEEICKQKFMMIESWQQSGLTQKAWCIQESIAYHSFHYWYRRYRQQNIDNQTTANAPGFVKLKVQESFCPLSIEIHFPQGARLFFHAPVSAEYIKSLLS